MIVLEKSCSTCHRVLSASEFLPHKATQSHLSSECRDCHYKRGRAEHLKRVYGITAEEYDAMLVAQGGVCAICGLSDTSRERKIEGRKRLPRRNIDTLRIDHDHVTGKVRGLLCTPCNQAIGHMRDDPELLRRAAVYLDSYISARGEESACG